MTHSMIRLAPPRQVRWKGNCHGRVDGDAPHPKEPPSWLSPICPKALSLAQSQQLPDQALGVLQRDAACPQGVQVCPRLGDQQHRDALPGFYFTLYKPNSKKLGHLVKRASALPENFFDYKFICQTCLVFQKHATEAVWNEDRRQMDKNTFFSPYLF